MQNQSERDKIIEKYRNACKQIRLETDETKKNELKKKASEIYDSLIREEFGDKNIKRFNN